MRPGFIVLTVSLLACGRRDFNEADAALPPGDAIDAPAATDAVVTDGPTACPASYVLVPAANISYSVNQPARLASWLSATNACLGEGQHLARPRNALDALALTEHVGGADIWVDISTVATPGVWSDGEGQPVSYLPWELTWPDGTGDCVQMTMDSEMHDVACMAAYAYVCECRP
jgi:hypothetical protein